MNLRHDLRFAWRTLRKNPGFLVVATLSLGLGIALNTTIFSLVHATLFRTAEVDRPDELVNIYSLKAGTSDLNPQSVPDYRDLSAAASSFTDLIGHSLAIMNVRTGTRPTPLLGSVVTQNYFDVLGVKAQIGRTFVEEEALGRAAPPTVLLTDRYWQRAFGGDRDVLARSMRIGGTDFEIVGVLPPRFRGLARGLEPDVFVPLAQVEFVEPLGEIVTEGRSGGLGTLDWRGKRFMTVVGRLAPGVSVAAAEAEIDALTKNLANEYVESNRDRQARLIPTSRVRIDPDFDSTLVPAAMVILALVAMVLLIACANIGNMLLAKAEGRKREIAVRLSLGAGRWQLIRLLLVESFLLATLGGLAGLAFAAAATRLLSQLRFDLPVALVLDPRLDPPVVLFTLCISIVTGLLFGLIPALQASSASLVSALKAEPRTAGKGRLRRWFQPARALVVLQVALSLVLLVGAGLLKRSVSQARSVDLGFDAERIGTITLDLSSLSVEEGATETKWAELTRTLEALPEIERAGFATRLPLDLNMHTSNFLIPGHRESESDPPLTLDVTQASNSYFETLGIVLEEGSWFPHAGDPGAASVYRTALVNRAAADRFWPNESPIGKTFRRGTHDSAEITIIGVVQDYKVRTPGERPRPMFHLSRSPTGLEYGNLIYRTASRAGATEATAIEALIQSEPDLFVLESTTLSRRRDLVLLPIRLGGILVSGLSGLALLLAVTGLAGLVAYWVSRRTKEIGIRVAVGAARGDIVSLVFKRSLALVAVGGVVGLLGSLALGQVLRTVLYVPAADPVSYFLGLVALTAAASAATLVPIHRATKVDTVKALRAE